MTIRIFGTKFREPLDGLKQMVATVGTDPDPASGDRQSPGYYVGMLRTLPTTSKVVARVARGAADTIERLVAENERLKHDHRMTHD